MIVCAAFVPSSCARTSSISVLARGGVRGGVFGTAVATMGMLMTTAFILAMDTFGPITDNAGGIAQFAHAEGKAREIEAVPRARGVGIRDGLEAEPAPCPLLHLGAVRVQHLDHAASDRAEAEEADLDLVHVNLDCS